MGRRQNIFLITIDCLRADYIGCFCKRTGLTPNLDELARNGVVFSQAIANGPSTPFSFPSIFLSSFALIDPKFPKISNFRYTIAEILKINGYETAGFNSNPYLSKYYNYNLGFNFFDDIFSEEKEKFNKGIKSFIKKYKKLYRIAQKVLKKLKLRYKVKPPYQRATKINQKALKWVKSSNREFFIWIHYMDTHHPFIPPEKFRNTSIRKINHAEKILKKNPLIVDERDLENIKTQYINTIRYVDYEIGELIKELKDLGVYENSLIIITADHGEEFKEHGGFSHECKLFEELIHVPLIITGPKIPKNKEINDLVSHLDIAPTILDYLNLEDINDFLGCSLMEVITTKTGKFDRDGVISESLVKDKKVSLSIEDSFAITSYRTKDWKFIVNDENNEKELYNLIEDPHETRNLNNTNLAISKKFEKKIIDHKNFKSYERSKLKERKQIKTSTEKLIFDRKI